MALLQNGLLFGGIHGVDSSHVQVARLPVPLQLENQARAAYERVAAADRAKMGGCVVALPGSEEMRDYLPKLRAAWLDGWCNHPGQYRHLLLQLYHCIAFLCYEGNAFWASFGEAVGDKGIAVNPSRQTEINDTFAHIARHLGLEVVGASAGRRLCVQSAVRHVGIPVPVWRGFVEVCERLFLEPEDWRRWPDERWEEAIHLWLGGRKNLRAFFVENRPTAVTWLDEMLEARRVLEKNPAWTLDDVAQVSHLRPEYFDGVPETATFLRPVETETLFRDRPRLRLRWQPGCLVLHLEPPRLKDENLLPSEWAVLDQRVQASTNPVPIPLHRRVFTPHLALKLVRAESELAAYRLRGLWPWGLWSESSGAFISSQAHELPVDDYLLISKSPLSFTNRDGWLGDDEDEARWNQEMQMPDGSTCFASRLVPAARRATLEVQGWHRITFAPRARLELRVFPRVTERFSLSFTPPNSVTLTAWPRLVVKAPKGLLAGSSDETQTLLQEEFRLLAGDIRVPGDWRHDEDASQHLDGEDVFFYRVREDWLPPANDSRPARVVRDFRDLGRIEPPAPQAHEVTIQLRATRHGVIPFGDSPEIHVRKEPPLSQTHADKLAVPFHAYWPWFLLTVTQDHATWEEIRLAFEMMNYGVVPLNFHPFQQIERERMAVRRGQRWTDFENRVLFGRHEGGSYTVRYSGLTSAIYPVLRQIEPVERISARWERGRPPHLEFRFSLRGDTDKRLRAACQRAGVRVMHESLWTR
jgi:hypothetical protein